MQYSPEHQQVTVRSSRPKGVKTLSIPMTCGLGDVADSLQRYQNDSGEEVFEITDEGVEFQKDGTTVTSSGAELNILDGVTATASEINNAADVSARTLELTASGSVTAGIQSVELNHTSVTIAATIVDATNNQGLFIVKATTEPGVAADHTLTLTAGTFDGTNNVATFADINDTLVVYFDSAGNGTIIENVGSVALS